MSLPLPKLIVFDLDYTLWPFWCDTHISPPIKANALGSAVTDRQKDTFAFYKDVGEILTELRNNPNVKVGVASRTHAPKIAMDLLEKLLINGEPAKNYFDAFAWGVNSKVNHIRELNAETQYDYHDIILYDDEDRNIDVQNKLGVTFAEVRRGLDRRTFEKGLQLWRDRKAKAEL